MSCFEKRQTVRAGVFTDGCPSPTRIECIEVFKVYDFVFQLDSVQERINLTGSTGRQACDFQEDREVNHLSNGSGSGSGGPTGAIRPSDVVRCDIMEENIGLEVVNVDRTDLENGFARVTLTVTIPVKVQVFRPDNETPVTRPVQETFVITKTILLCFPEGVELVLHTKENLFRCNCILIVPPGGPITQAVCTVEACLIIQSGANVKLLVPSFGFCQPQPAQNVAIGGCPPEDLFPPQCDDDDC